MRERLINRRRRGHLGEASAIVRLHPRRGWTTLADPGIGDGRREGVTLGGAKFSEFERGQPILDLV
jgi:hypothetical protein